MKVINLRDIYPHYTQDCFVEVTDEVADLFSEFDHKEAAYRLRTYRHKAYYSLDRNDGIEHEALFVALSPHELYERKVVFCQVLFPEKSVGIPFFQQGIFPAFSGHYASLRMRACSIR